MGDSAMGRVNLHGTAKVADNRDMATSNPANPARITSRPGQRGGQTCIRGLRITVREVLAMRAAGMSEEEILVEYPYLEQADFAAVYAYSADTEKKRR
jgi:uncharacterized protein (DUF433 family)